MPEITMPKLSDTMTEGTLLRWCKKKGDPVEIGDLLAEVETDKATMEMESFEEGTLTELFVEEGGKVPVGAPIAMILAEGEELSKQPALTPLVEKGAAAAKPSEQTDRGAHPSIGQPSGGIGQAPGVSKSPQTMQGGAVHRGKPAIPAGGLITPPSGARIKASPLAKKLVQQYQMALHDVVTILGEGSGPGGRIIAADVIASSEKKRTSPTAGASSTSQASGATPALPVIEGGVIEGNRETKIPLTGMRRTIAQRLLASKTQIPHFYLSIEIDVAPMMALRKQLVAEHDAGRIATKITYNDIIVLAAARGAQEHPNINASFSAEGIYQYEEVNAAVAIAVEDGLVTPVLRNAAALSLEQISTQIKDFATRARAKKLKPEEFAGGTITISNLGAYKIDQFFAIVNPPQAMILAIGGIIKKPIVTAEETLAIGHRMSLSLSGDHRVVDGATAALYLKRVQELLEAPSQLMV